MYIIFVLFWLTQVLLFLVNPSQVNVNFLNHTTTRLFFQLDQNKKNNKSGTQYTLGYIFWTVQVNDSPSILSLPLQIKVSGNLLNTLFPFFKQSYIHQSHKFFNFLLPQSRLGLQTNSTIFLLVLYF